MDTKGFAKNDVKDYSKKIIVLLLVALLLSMNIGNYAWATEENQNTLTQLGEFDYVGWGDYYLDSNGFKHPSQGSYASPLYAGVYDINSVPASGDQLYNWVKTQNNRIDENPWEIVYCFNANMLYPGSDNGADKETMEYAKITDATKADMDKWARNTNPNSEINGNLKSNILNVIYNGYPYDKAGIMTEYGLNEDQFRAVTQAAIWWLTDGESLEDSKDTMKVNVTFPHNLLTWGRNADEAYNFLIGEATSANISLQTPPENFELDLYISKSLADDPSKVKYEGGDYPDGDAVQNLLGTKLSKLDDNTQPETYPVVVSKVSPTNQPLAGVRIQIKQDNQVLEDFTSTTEDKELTLSPGTYTYHEESVPEGCGAVEDFEFTVDEDGNITLEEGLSNTIAIINQQGKLIVYAQQPATPPTLALTASKTLTGATLAVDQFSFELKDSTDTVLQTKKNAADGTVTFDTITYSASDFGKTFDYTVSEKNEGTDGVTYDETVYTVKVTIDAQGNLTYKMYRVGDGLAESVTDDNTYTANHFRPQGSGNNHCLTIDEKVAYCFNLERDWPWVGETPPKNEGFKKLENVSNDDMGKYSNGATKDEVLKVIYNGYPYDNAGLKTQYNLTNDQFRAVTQVALWYYTEGAYANVDDSMTDQQRWNNTFMIINRGVGAYGIQGEGNFWDGADDATKASMYNCMADLTGATVKYSQGTGYNVNSVFYRGNTDSLQEPNGNLTVDLFVHPTDDENIDEEEKVQNLLSVGTVNPAGGGTATPEEVDEMTFANTIETTTSAEVTISKKAVGGTEELTGASLKITVGDENGATATDAATGEELSWTSTGTAKVVSLVPGTYTMVETAAPEGYEVATAITFTVNENKTITVGNTTTTSEADNVVTMFDALKKAEVTISKKAVGGTEELTGASLKITVGDENGATATDAATGEELSWTSTGTAKVVSLVPGTYTMVETAAPEGYEVATAITFTVNENKTITVGNTTTTSEADNVVTMFDALKKADVTISKKAVGGTEELTGASLKITVGDENGATATDAATGEELSWTSTGTAKVVSLVPGTYTMVETAAPEGYEVATAITFTVNENKTITVGNTTTTSEADNVVTMFDALKKAEVTISKKAVGGTEELTGASLKITVGDENGATATDAATGEELSWTSTGTAKVVSLVPGTYTMVETAAPEGYEVATAITFTVNENKTITVGNTTTTSEADNVVTMFDALKKVDVTISKKAVGGTEELTGASLKITVGDENGATATDAATGEELSWTSTGTAKVVSLVPGTYTMVETAAPEGYEVATAITFTVNENKTITVGNTTTTSEADNVVTMFDALKKVDVTISKKAVGGTEELTGASLKITVGDENGATATDAATGEELSWTSTGTAKVVSLVPGTYTMVETAAPEGYEVATAITFTVNENKTITVGNTTTTSEADNVVTMFDALKKADVTISKKAVGGTEELTGASLKITVGDENGATATDAATGEELSWTSTGTAKVVSLVPGTYTMVETAAPEGYEVATAITFTVNENKTITVGNTTTTSEADNVVTMFDALKKAEVTISKKAVGGTEELTGASLKITVGDENGATATDAATGEELSWTSTGTAKVVSLVPGTYTMVETAAPEGYEVATAITFTVNENKTITVGNTTTTSEADNVVTMFDALKKADVTISKKAVGGTEELTGASLKITVGDENGATATDAATGEELSWTSTGTAKVVSLVPGTYTMVETAAPEGYEVATAITFTVNENKTITVGNTTTTSEADNVVTMFDALKKAEVTISKKAVGGTEELTGASLKITVGDENGATATDAATGEELSWTSTGTAKVVSLVPGTYTMVETAAPEGYEVATAITFTVNENKTITVGNTTTTSEADNVVTMFDALKKAEVTISKKAVGGTEELTGASLKITVGDENGATATDAATGEELSWTSTGTAKVVSLVPGTYTMVETAAPEGYEVATAITFTVNENKTITVGNTTTTSEADNVVTMFDALKKAEVTISKKAVGGTEELTGASLKITVGDENGATATDAATGEELSWTSTGTAKVVSLVPGTYTMVETAAPEGYEVATAITFTVNENKTITVGNTTTTSEADNVVTMFDALKKAEVTISKKAVGGTEELTGASLKITVGDENGATATDAATGEELSWTSTGTAKVVSLVPGTYTMVETAAPEGYEVATAITFTVNENKTITVGNTTTTSEADNVVTMFDALKKAEVTISKKAVGGTEELTGASLKITVGDENGATATDAATGEELSWTSTGTAKVVSLVPGTYTMVETAAPEGYEVATAITFTVNENKTITVGNTTTTSEADNVVTMFDALKKAEVTISKINLGGQPLAGAQIQILNEAGTVIESYTSTTEAKEITVAPGTYTFHEEAAPNGYKVVTDFKFTVKEDGTVELTNVASDVAKYVEGVLVVTDQYEEQTVVISKINLGGQPLAGAKIQIIAQDGTVIESYTSTTEAKEITVAPGTYTFHEEAAPNGYKVVTDFKFTVKEDGTVELTNVASDVAKYVEGVLVVTDQYEEQTVVISKINLGGQPLAGAKIQIIAQDGTVIESYTSTTEAKEITVAPGTYTFHEEAAPNGYKVVTDFKFTVKEDGTVELTNVASDVAKYVEGVLVVTDQYEEQTVVISKINLGGQPLAGAKIQILNEAGTVIESYTSTTEAKEIIVAPGTYTFHEEAAPNGYKVVTDFTFTVAEDGTVTVNGVETSVAKYENGMLIVTDEDADEPTPTPEDVTIVISKINLGGQPLAGARIQIIAQDGTVIESYTSTTEAKEIIVTPGTYTFHEEAAPNGYKVVTDFTFTVAEDGTVTVNGVETSVAKYENGMLIVTDEDADEPTPTPEDVTIVISKINLGGQPLAGARIQIIAQDGTVIESYTSTTEAKEIIVAPGTYTFHEEAAPNGYKVVTDFTFTVAEDGTVTVNGVETSVAKYENGMLIVTDEHLGGELGDDTLGEQPEDETNVATGDDTNIMLYVLLLELSLAACAVEVLNILKKKRNSNC